MTDRQCVENQRHYSANKGLYSQGSGLPNGHIWLWKLTVKKAEHQKTDDFDLWCWRRLLRVPWATRRSNQSILREINPKYSLEELMLKLQCFDLTDNFVCVWCSQTTCWKSSWCWERLSAEEKRASENEMAGWHHWCNGHELGQTSGDSEGQGGLVCSSPWGCKEFWTGLSDWACSHRIYIYIVYTV